MNLDNRHNGQVVEVRGRVVRMLSDDTRGDRHQRFILELDHAQTVLVAHNFDIGRRLPYLEPGVPVTVRGEYAFTDEGGVLHWTHRDPDEEHASGWIEFHDERYD